MDEARRTPWARVAGIVLVILLGGCGAGAYALYLGIQGHDVGPDADEMAQDPVLHLDLADAEPQEIYADRGFKGGPAPALANPGSEASRTWLSDTDDWQGLLLAAVTAVDAQGATWSHLFCSIDSVSLYGTKGIVVDDETVGANVEVFLSQIGSATEPMRLHVGLSSDGSESTPPPPSAGPAPTIDIVGSGCPDALVALVTRTPARAGP